MMRPLHGVCLVVSLAASIGVAACKSSPDSTLGSATLKSLDAKTIVNWDLLGARMADAIYAPSPDAAMTNILNVADSAASGRFTKEKAIVRDTGDLRWGMVWNDSEAAIIVRGTESDQKWPNGATNWARNLAAGMQSIGVDARLSCPALRDCARRFHVGFLTTARTVLKSINDENGDLLGSQKNKQIYFIGHSLGGATAQILSLLVYDQIEPAQYPYVFTYGAPKVGNNWANEAIYKRSYVRKWYHPSDPVPSLPPAFTGDVKNLYFFTNDLNSTTGKRWTASRVLGPPVIAAHSSYANFIAKLAGSQDTSGEIRLTQDETEFLTSVDSSPLPAPSSSEGTMTQYAGPMTDADSKESVVPCRNLDDDTGAEVCYGSL